ncbi:MAG: nucleolar RNA-binding Nop10p family protein [Candidatus Caldarchaeum sp.]
MKAGRIRKCLSCKTYTLKESCPRCGGKTVSPHPIHFTPETRYAGLLLKARKSRGGVMLFNRRSTVNQREDGSGDKDTSVQHP